MDEPMTREALAKKIAEIAFAPACDALNLAMKPDAAAKKSADLRLVTELKWGKDGVMELKLLDRLKLFELLAELLRPEESAESENLYAAIDSAAKALQETGEKGTVTDAV